MAQCLDQTLNAVPVQLDPWTDDEAFVFHHAAAIEDHSIVVRFERGDSGFDPMHPFGDKRAHGACSRLRVKDAAAHHGPAGLIVMDIGRINYCDLKTGFARLEAGGGGDATCTRTYDDHFIRGVARICWGFAAVDDTAYNTCHIVSRCFGRGEDVSDAAFTGLCQGPQCGRAGPCAAIGKHRTGQRGEGGVELGRILVADRARDDGQIDRFKTLRLCRFCDFVKGRLVVAFAVRTVTDQCAKARILDRFHVSGHNLRADRKASYEGLDFHYLSPVRCR